MQQRLRSEMMSPCPTRKTGMIAMLEPEHRTPKPVLRQVLGWVLVLPLLVALVRLPFPLGLVLALGSIVASAYGVRFARRHASRRVMVLALIGTLLNIVSMVALGTASPVMALHDLSWPYWYHYLADWIYWNV